MALNLVFRARAQSTDSAALSLPVGILLANPLRLKLRSGGASEGRRRGAPAAGATRRKPTGHEANHLLQ